MSQILSGVKVQGQTSAGAAIATVTVNLNDDGTLDFTDDFGNALIYSGNNAEMNKLIEMIFTGAAGLAGQKLFSWGD